MTLITKAGFLLLKIAIVPVMLIKGSVVGAYQHTVTAIQKINTEERVYEFNNRSEQGKREAKAINDWLKKEREESKKKGEGK